MALERMVRFIVYDRLDQFKCEILPDEVMDVVSKEAVNGEHSLTITTTQELDKTDRIVVRDGMGLWHEFVVLGITASHDTAGVTVKEYYCPWSLQYDLSATYIDTNVGLVPGHASVPHSARDALTAALSGTTRWTIGTVGVTTMASASFYRRSGWEGMDTVLEVWGGELAVTIGVGAAGVTSRQVSLLPHVGTSTATRRFDYAGDLTSIQRIVSDEVWPCRIVPLGCSTETSAGGYTRRPTISSVNQGVPWIQDDEAVPYTRIPNGQGGWEYPTLVVKNDTYSDPAALKAWATEHVSEYTRPQVCYKAEVAQFVKAGLNAHGVALGDNVVVVDREFDSAGLRIDARVLEIQQDLLDSTRMKLTIGNTEGSLAQQFGSLARSVTSITSHFENMGEYQSTATYLSELLASINEVANALGGYAYYTEGQGIRTYDRPVTDPLVGAEATKVVEIKGGTIRIADSRTSGGDWDWRTVFVAGHIAAELITAAQITTGYIGNASSTSYWDIDNGTIVIVNAAQNPWGRNEQLKFSALSFTDNSGWLNTITTEQSLLGLMLGVDSSSAWSGNGNIYLMPNMPVGSSSSGSISGIASRFTLKLMGNYSSGTTQTSYRGCLSLGSRYIEENIVNGTGTVYPGIVIANDAVYLCAKRDNYTTDYGQSVTSIESALSLNATQTVPSVMRRSLTVDGSLRVYKNSSIPSATNSSVVFGEDSSARKVNLTVYGNTNLQGTLSVSSTKSRRVSTNDYSERLLYSYETPAPYFGDIGSATIGEDGTCYVSIDDVFTETARTDMAYQVFLQKCGRGDLWVAEKRPSYFVVRGTAGLAFDWEVKARQKDYEMERLEDCGICEFEDTESQAETPEICYQDELNEYLRAIEKALQT